MLNRTLPPALLAMLAATLASTDASVLPVELRDGESIEQAVARALAEHREECEECRQAHAAAQAVSNTKYEATPDQIREKVKHKQREELEALGKRHAAEREALGRELAEDSRTAEAKPFGAPYGEQAKGTDTVKAENTRKPIGYMAFAPHNGEMKAIPGSFAIERETVEAIAEAVESHPIAQVLTALGAGKASVRPVYGE